MIREAMLYDVLEGGRVSCRLCSHRCRIAAGQSGICLVRENREGKLFTHAYGEVIAAHVDPIEKKPLFHFLPGSQAFSIATAGCNFRCPFCQNWEISQLSESEKMGRPGYRLLPGDIVREAKKNGCRSISYTYTEPTIFFEYALETSQAAKEAGLANTFVTNGYMTGEAIEVIRPFLDAANVDLKSFSEETYKHVCKASLEPVLESIRLMKKAGIWVEVTTLVVPGLNDGQEELRNIAGFIAGIDPGIPWHISRFHPDYKYTDTPPTPLRTMRTASDLGREQGLRFIYLGNVWGEAENTCCPQCGLLLIRRQGYSVEEIHIQDSRCPRCRNLIPGVFLRA